jgi:hypothetical protein
MSLKSTDRILGMWCGTNLNANIEMINFASDTSGIQVKTGAQGQNYTASGGAANDAVNTVYLSGGYNYSISQVSTAIRTYIPHSGLAALVKSAITAGVYSNSMSSGTTLYNAKIGLGVNATSFATDTTNAVSKASSGSMTTNGYGNTAI